MILEIVCVWVVLKMMGLVIVVFILLILFLKKLGLYLIING